MTIEIYISDTMF